MKHKTRRSKRHNQEARIAAKELAEFIRHWSEKEAHKEGCEGVFLIVK